MDDPLIIAAKYFSIHKITIGASQGEVQAAFGRPRRIEKAPLPAVCKEESVEDYGGLKANFCNSKLVHLKCYAKGFRTPSGIEVGMELKEVLKRQWNTIVRDSDSGQVIRYQAESPDEFLIVHLRNGRVVEIELCHGLA
jgi:hypothetical protein